MNEQIKFIFEPNINNLMQKVMKDFMYYNSIDIWADNNINVEPYLRSFIAITFLDDNVKVINLITDTEEELSYIKRIDQINNIKDINYINYVSDDYISTNYVLCKSLDDFCTSAYTADKMFDNDIINKIIDFGRN